jgi:hypothetical protein
MTVIKKLNVTWPFAAVHIIELYTWRIAAPGLVSSPGEFHPEALAEPYVNVSAHTAPIIQPRKANQVAN